MKLERRERVWPEVPTLRDVLADPWSPLNLWNIRTEDMRVEEFRDNGNLIVRCEIPGIDPDKDVEVTVRDQMLHISAERKLEREEEYKTGYRSEFRYGSFERIVALPLGASEKDIKAKYHDGILEVRVPVSATTGNGARVKIEHG